MTKKITTPSLLIMTVMISSMLILSSCCACRKGSPKIGSLEQDNWKLIEFKYDPIENSQIVLSFDAEKKMIYGTAPCNNFFAGYSLFKGENNITISNVGATRMACPEMDLEMNFTGALSTVTRIKIDGQHLLMLNNTGELVALLVSEPKK